MPTTSLQVAKTWAQNLGSGGAAPGSAAMIAVERGIAVEIPHALGQARRPSDAGRRWMQPMRVA